jgi:hypothetical protein
LKKVRLNLKRGARSWSFVIYDSSESAYYLRNEPVYSPDSEEEYRKVVVLKPGEIIEAEWMGAEWVYDDEVIPGFGAAATSSHEKFDRVRVCKFTSVKEVGDKTKTGYLELYSGWIHSGCLPWRSEAASDDVRVTEIKGRIKSKLDFSKLFQGTSLEEEEIIEERKMMSEEPVVLN